MKIADSTYKLLSEFQKLGEEIDEQVAQIRSDFQVLVYGCNTFNQVAKLWLQFEKVRAEYTGTAVSVLSKDVVARIKEYRVAEKK